jgi:hypothetical protein
MFAVAKLLVGVGRSVPLLQFGENAKEVDGDCACLAIKILSPLRFSIDFIHGVFERNLPKSFPI